MSDRLRLFMRVTDVSMLLYWLAATCFCLGLVTPPPTAMYDGYGTPAVDAWNWSFAPLDVAFALLGLLAVRLAQKGDARWQPLAIISLVLTMCAGLMAISYWAILGSFDLWWWTPNLLLFVLPLFWLPMLVRKVSS